jgi:hypothetical protein
VTWCFRLRGDLGATTKLELERAGWVLLDKPDEHVALHPADGAATLAAARRVQLRGSRYRSESDAAAAGERWLDWLTLLLACVNVGVDFGTRAPQGAGTAEYMQVLSEQVEAPVLNDVQGLMPFEQTDVPPRFLRVGPVTGMVSSPHRRLDAALERVVRAEPVMTARQRLAYDLYAASMSETNADARFMLLMMAVESLLDPQPRSAPAQSLVRGLIAQVRSSELERSEIDSIVGSLRWLAKDSISRTGRILAKSLRPRTYGRHDPVDFFTNCYTLRSALAHGADPRPSRTEVDLRAARLEPFVAHLITGPLLEPGLGPVV